MEIAKQMSNNNSWRIKFSLYEQTLTRANIFVLNRKHGFCLSCNYCQYEYEWQMLSLKLELSLFSLALERMTVEKYS